MRLKSIRDVEEINDILILEQSLSTNNKYLYSEVSTPYSIVKYLIDIIPINELRNKNNKFLDPGCGNGYISIYLYYILFNKLKYDFESFDLCSKHIIENMLYMIDININHIEYLHSLFNYKNNIICIDFLKYDTDIVFDVIISNPPYIINMNEFSSSKKKEGYTIWPDFIKKSLKLLKKDGYLSTIIPSIWMKPDNIMHNIILSYEIKSLYCYNNTETNKIFKGLAQTPTSLFVLKNKSRENFIELYDKSFNLKINFPINNSIPVFGSYIILKLLPYLQKFGNISKYVIKTNMPSKKIKFSNNCDETYMYKNIYTCKLEKNHAYLVYNYSDKELPYCKKEKLILGHKMYGFPFHDKNGSYGVSNRDNYIIMTTNLSRLKEFLDSKLVFYLYESTRYRMKYLERFAFEYILDINNDPFFPKNINDASIFEYFKLNNYDIDIINKFYKKDYIKL